MATDITPYAPSIISLPESLPTIIIDAGDKTAWRFIEFFTATIRNPNTREAYARAVGRFLAWCEGRGLYDLHAINPVLVAAYIEHFPGSKPTIKQHPAAIRQCFDWLVSGGVLASNPAASVKGPKYVIKKGKTPVLSTEQARALIKAIHPGSITGLRDRALIGAMVYTFARVSTVIDMRVEDYYPNGKRWWFRLHEKGGKFHEVPAHHTAEELMDAYLKEVGLSADKTKKEPLFCTVDRCWQLTDRPMYRNDVVRMIKRWGHGHGRAARHLLSHVPGHRYHGIPGERWHQKPRPSPRTTLHANTRTPY